MAACGGKVLNADEIAHRSLAPARDIEAAARRRWGDAVFGPNGRIDPPAWSRSAPPPPEGPPNREYLEQLTHAEIIRIINEELAVLAGSSVKAAVIDCPV